LHFFSSVVLQISFSFPLLCTQPELENKATPVGSVIEPSCTLTLLYAFSQRTLDGEQGGGPSSKKLRQMKQKRSIDTKRKVLRRWQT
uniref:Uncharacterized protein n=1 Tax=Seriola dumerili TaxID=41447 RepID=A0A3B4V7Y0_SERDU